MTPNIHRSGPQFETDRSTIRTRRHTIDHQKRVGWYRAVLSQEPVMAVLPSTPTPPFFKENLNYDPEYPSFRPQFETDRSIIRTRKHTISHQKRVGWYRAVLSAEPVMAVLPSFPIPTQVTKLVWSLYVSSVLPE